jgi:hypothetical protein
MQLIHELERTRAETLKYFELGEDALARTYGPGKWSARYVLLHIVDSETVLYERIRRIISEPRQVVWYYDEAAWARELDYSRLPLDIARDVYIAVRRAIIYYANQFYESKGHIQFVHNISGAGTLKDVFDQVASHNEHHLNHIRTALSVTV